MQANKSVRIEATKLFWSCPNTWYVMDGDWLIGEDGYPGSVCYSMKFASHVQQLEVEFAWLFNSFKMGEKRHIPVTNQARRFWEILIRVFPCAQRVVLSDKDSRREGAPLEAEYEAVVRECPANLKLFICARENAADPPFSERKMWSLSAVGNGTPYPLNPQDYNRILMPSKSFVGFLGEYQRLHLSSQYLHFRRQGLRRYIIETADRYFLEGREGGEFGCPHSHCGEKFTQKGEWFLHARSTILPSHDQVEDFTPGKNMIRYRSIKGIPEDISAPLHDEQVAFFVNYEDLGAKFRLLKLNFGVYGSDRFVRSKESVIAQLNDDPDYKHVRPAEKCRTFENFVFIRGGC